MYGDDSSALKQLFDCIKSSNTRVSKVYSGTEQALIDEPMTAWSGEPSKCNINSDPLCGDCQRSVCVPEMPKCPQIERKHDLVCFMPNYAQYRNPNQPNTDNTRYNWRGFMVPERVDACVCTTYVYAFARLTVPYRQPAYNQQVWNSDSVKQLSGDDIESVWWEKRTVAVANDRTKTYYVVSRKQATKYVANTAWAKAGVQQGNMIFLSLGSGSEGDASTFLSNDDASFELCSEIAPSSYCLKLPSGMKGKDVYPPDLTLATLATPDKLSIVPGTADKTTKPHYYVPTYAEVNDVSIDRYQNETGLNAYYTAGGWDMWNRFTTHIHTKNPSAKAMLALGGWDAEFAQAMSLIAREVDGTAKEDQKYYTVNKKGVVPTHEQFAIDTKTLLCAYDFDGLFIDWEFPCDPSSNPYDECGTPGFECQADAPTTQYCPPGNKKSFVLLVRYLKSYYRSNPCDNVGSRGQTLTLGLAIGPNNRGILSGIDGGNLASGADFQGLMSYDFYGSWDKSPGPNSPLYQKKRNDDGDVVDRTVSMPPPPLYISNIASCEVKDGDGMPERCDVRIPPDSNGNVTCGRIGLYVSQLGSSALKSLLGSEQGLCDIKSAGFALTVTSGSGTGTCTYREWIETTTSRKVRNGTFSETIKNVSMSAWIASDPPPPTENASDAGPASVPTPVPSSCFYVVQSGDQCNAIGTKYDLNAFEMVSLNPTKCTSMLRIGETLCVCDACKLVSTTPITGGGPWSPTRRSDGLLYFEISCVPDKPYTAPFSIEESVKWLHVNGSGVPKHSLYVGLATYARGWTMSSDTVKAEYFVGQGTASKPRYVTKQSGVVTLFAMTEKADGIWDPASVERTYDEGTVTAIAIDRSSKQFYSYDSYQTLIEKTEWFTKTFMKNVKGVDVVGESSLTGTGSGIIMWSLDMDDFNNGAPNHYAVACYLESGNGFAASKMCKRKPWLKWYEQYSQLSGYNDTTDLPVLDTSAVPGPTDPLPPIQKLPHFMSNLARASTSHAPKRSNSFGSGSTQSVFGGTDVQHVSFCFDLKDVLFPKITDPCGGAPVLTYKDNWQTPATCENTLVTRTWYGFTSCYGANHSHLKWNQTFYLTATNVPQIRNATDNGARVFQNSTSFPSLRSESLVCDGTMQLPSSGNGGTDDPSHDLIATSCFDGLLNVTKVVKVTIVRPAYECVPTSEDRVEWAAHCHQAGSRSECASVNDANCSWTKMDVSGDCVVLSGKEPWKAHCDGATSKEDCARVSAFCEWNGVATTTTLPSTNTTGVTVTSNTSLSGVSTTYCAPYTAAIELSAKSQCGQETKLTQEVRYCEEGSSCPKQCYLLTNCGGSNAFATTYDCEYMEGDEPSKCGNERGVFESLASCEAAGKARSSLRDAALTGKGYEGNVTCPANGVGSSSGGCGSDPPVAPHPVDPSSTAFVGMNSGGYAIGCASCANGACLRRCSNVACECEMTDEEWIAYDVTKATQYRCPSRCNALYEERHFCASTGNVSDRGGDDGSSGTGGTPSFRGNCSETSPKYCTPCNDHSDCGETGATCNVWAAPGYICNGYCDFASGVTLSGESLCGRKCATDAPCGTGSCLGGTKPTNCPTTGDGPTSVPATPTPAPTTKTGQCTQTSETFCQPCSTDADCGTKGGCWTTKSCNGFCNAASGSSLCGRKCANADVCGSGDCWSAKNNWKPVC